MAEKYMGYEPTQINVDDYITINSGFTVNQKYGYWVAPNLVFICLDLAGTINEGQTVVGTATNKVMNLAYLPGRATTSGWVTKPATAVVISTGEVRVHSAVSAIGSTFAGIIVVKG